MVYYQSENSEILEWTVATELELVCTGDLLVPIVL